MELHHSLEIHTGRYSSTVREQRYCKLCNSNEVEDELHFILKCPYFSTIRNRYTDNFYFTHPNMFKLIQLFTSDDKKLRLIFLYS